LPSSPVEEGVNEVCFHVPIKVYVDGPLNVHISIGEVTDFKGYRPRMKVFPQKLFLAICSKPNK